MLKNRYEELNKLGLIILTFISSKIKIIIQVSNCIVNSVNQAN
jgi:hypothetical protein